MYRKLLVAFVALLLLPVFLLAQDGKLRGKATDKESGEALIGANVVVEGTGLGAATDVNGEYVILAVPPSIYTVRVTYIGYSPVTISNIRVNAGLTTTQDFALSSSAVQVQAVEIVAERPLIQRNTTNTVRITTTDEIRALPFRGIQNIVTLDAGVVQQGGNLYVRGGRAGDIGYSLDGANITNPFSNSQNVGIIQEAVEEVQLQAGGFTAEYGGANSGIIRTTMRTGGSSLKATVDYQTDDFAKPGKEFLGTTSLGRRVGIATLGGPIPGISGARFFLAGQHDYARDDQPRFITPFRFDSLVTDGLGARAAGLPLPGAVEMKENYLYNNWNYTNSVQGTLLFDVNPVKLRFSGSYEYQKNMNGGGWPGALGNVFWTRNSLSEASVMFGNLKATHVLSPTTYYEVGVSYQRRSTRTYDKDFGDNWKAYQDSIPNAQLGYTDFTGRYQPPLVYSTIFAFQFTAPDAPNNSYYKGLQTDLAATIDFTSQVSSQWELRAGGRLESWTYRSFGIDNIRNYLQYLYGVDGRSPRSFTSDYERRVRLVQQATITTFGYDIDGNETEGTSFPDQGITVDKPVKPILASAYIQNRFEYRDIIVNAGVRYEYMAPKGPSIPQSDYSSPPVDAALNIVQESAFTEMPSFSLLLPRISFSFPVTDRTVFFAQYGKYAQFPRMDQLYTAPLRLSQRINPSQRVSYWLGGTGQIGVVAWGAKPERTTQYEAGFRQTLTDNLAFTLTGFYKDQKDQLSIRRTFSDLGVPLFVSLQNEDFGTTKGVELTLQLRRTNRLQAQVNYTLSDARGTGSDVLSSRNSVSDERSARFPFFINPLDYNQTHRGTIMLDYRWSKGDGGPVLEGLGANILLSFNSGHNYTKIKEPQNLGQANPWNIGVRALLDTRSRNPVEPINSSTTPWVYNIDLQVGKVFYLSNITFEVYANVLNLLNTKQVVNVYPTTGVPQDDGWLKSPFAEPYKAIPHYTEFYKAINLENRWALGYNNIGMGDLYGSPRQIRFGVRFEY
jgi:outer membrane receptor protein involved in Fe transport